jgi:hypothetical protein
VDVLVVGLLPAAPLAPALGLAALLPAADADVFVMASGLL